MFKNATLFAIQLPQPMQVMTFDHAIESQQFTPCGATQAQSFGWAPPRGEDHGAMVESIAGHLIMRFVRETKSVPAQAIKRALDEVISDIEDGRGRKPGRKETRELRDEVMQDLLPHAFAKRTEVPVWIDPARSLLVVGSTTTAVTDLVISALVQALPGATIGYLNTQVAPQAAMTQWLAGADEDWPSGFAPGRDVELKSNDEFKTVVKYNRHHLDDEEMRRHIGQGKLPTQLALDWQGRVSFTLTQATQIKKIKFLDTVFDGQKAEDAGFDADWAIATGELSGLIADLAQALGGLLGQEGEAA
ncbi:MAG: recombination-associated protein RdgC [Aestuariivirga sp.]